MLCSLSVEVPGSCVYVRLRPQACRPASTSVASTEELEERRTVRGLLNSDNLVDLSMPNHGGLRAPQNHSMPDVFRVRPLCHELRATKRVAIMNSSYSRIRNGAHY
eukprot:2734816-Amphidinium_carterae.1